MLKVAFVAANGEVSHVIEPADDLMFEDGAQVGDFIAKIIPFESDNEEYLQTKTYSPTDGWGVRTARPSRYHNWDGSSWILDSVELAKQVRRQRDLMLSGSDWTQAADSPLSDLKKADWAAYRQQLRDVPANNTAIQHIDEVVWPDKPI
jgi:hypothetical protein